MNLFGGHKQDGGAGQLPANLRDNTQRFRAIFDSIEDGVVLIDGSRAIQLINPGAGAMCGWPAEEAMGIDVCNVIKLVTAKGEPVPEAENPFHQVFQSGQNIRGQDVFLVPRGKNQQIAINLSISPLVDDDKTVTAAAAVFRDVTQERAEQQQRADFISTASHEMRTPVAAIEGYLALALNDKVSTIDERARGYLEKAHASTQHLGQLFQDLLTSAKAEDGRLTSHPAVVEFGEFLEKLVSDLRLVAEKKGLFVEFITSSDADHVINATKETEAGGEKVVRPLYYVHIDPDRMREVVTNLFDNAVKYTPEGKISLGLTGNDQVVQCYIKDTGPGIPADDLPHLFQKFYRVDNSATRTVGGTGLGLFICRKIVELYGGRIWAESELGKGSSFYINLPR
ncbi:MAG: ATP-binding protein, partial [Candidatus Saccharimonadales bacterium]